MLASPGVTAADETIDPDPDQTITIPEWTLEENELTTQDYNITEIAYTEPGSNLTLSHPSLSDSSYIFDGVTITDGERDNYDESAEFIHLTDSGSIIEANVSDRTGTHLLVLLEGSADHDVLPFVVSRYSITPEYVPKTVSPGGEYIVTVNIDNPDDKLDGVEIGGKLGDEHIRTTANPLGNGTYQATIDIPEDTSEGEHSIHATALGPDYEVLGDRRDRLALSTVGTVDVETSDDDSDDDYDENGNSGPDNPDIAIVPPGSAEVNSNISFDANITGTNEDPEYNWTIGDQTYSDSIPTHNFTEPGEYQVTLTATFEEDVTATDTATITIDDESSSNDSETNEHDSEPQQPDLDDDDDESDDALAPSPIVIIATFIGMLLIFIYRMN